MANRAYERLPVDTAVQVRAVDAEQTRGAQLKDISPGGLFLETREPYQKQTLLEVQIDLPAERQVLLTGTVVHAVSPAQAEAWDGTPGVGLQFADLDEAQRTGLDAFLEFVRGRIDDELAAAPFDAELVSAIEAAHRKSDLCRILNVDARADTLQVSAAADARAEALSALLQHEQLEPAITQRLIACRLAVQRARSVLTSPAKRAGYLLRSGELSTAELVELFSGDAAAEQELEQLWGAQQATDAASAQALAEQAREFAERGDHSRAREAAERALRQHPFLFELRRQSQDWKEPG